MRTLIGIVPRLLAASQAPVVSESHEVGQNGLHTYRLTTTIDGNTVVVVHRGGNAREARGTAFRKLRHELRRAGQ